MKIPIQLRPKSDEELAKWKEKLAKGKEDGTHRYQVKNSFSVSGDLDQIAGTIEQRSNEALGSEYRVYKEDIKPLLREGASYISGYSFEFPKYKKESEKLWLEFSGTIQDGLVKIPIHLRPKSDEDLKQWKEKLAKGKEDGTYTYTFAGQTSIPNGSGDEKKRVAGIILNNSKNGLRGNPKIEEG
ncbi:MAG: hypothetical protein ACK5MD_08930, partial [Flavobacteriales bacterium]